MHDVQNVCRARSRHHAAGPLRLRSLATLESYESFPHAASLWREARRISAPPRRIRGSRGALLVWKCGGLTPLRRCKLSARSTDMTPISATLQNNLRAVLSADQIRPASPADSICGVQPQFLIEPATEQQLATALRLADESQLDRKSTRLNSSHVAISYAVFCLKKKKKTKKITIYHAIE